MANHLISRISLNSQFFLRFNRFEIRLEISSQILHESIVHLSSTKMNLYRENAIQKWAPTQIFVFYQIV